MEPNKLPNELEIYTIDQQGEEAIMSFVSSLTGVLQGLSERGHALEDQLAKNSRIRGKPLSSDGLKRSPKACSTKAPSER